MLHISQKTADTCGKITLDLRKEILNYEEICM